MLTHIELAHRLEEWAVGVARSLKNGRYRSWADDIGHEVSVELLVQKEQGLPVPEWPTALDGEPLRLVNRIARSLCPRMLMTLDQEVLVKQEEFTKATGDDGTREAHRRPDSIALGDEFSDAQIQAMTCVCGGDSRVTQAKLAEAAGLQPRTFKRVLRRLRDHRVEA